MGVKLAVDHVTIQSNESLVVRFPHFCSQSMFQTSITTINQIAIATLINHRIFTKEIFGKSSCVAGKKCN